MITASFTHTGGLPGNKTLSGIISKMYKGTFFGKLMAALRAQMPTV